MSRMPSPNPYLPFQAEVVDRIIESTDIVTLRLRLVDPQIREAYRFEPGQFNMLYMPRVGEVPISISSDPGDLETIDHTIRAVGRVTLGLVHLEPGSILGVRGPFGTGWPVEAARGRNILVVTGGIGCAPTASVVEYALRRRGEYGKLTVLHGVRQPEDVIYDEMIDTWCSAPGTQVLLTSQEAKPGWTGRVGLVTQLLDELPPESMTGVTMMCGPEPMMRAAADELLKRGVPIEDIYVSMERSMQCGLGHCGHCQFGKEFICKDGPVFPYGRVAGLMRVRGF